jgi:N-acetyl-gamma-glutamyl-phosphate reductase
MASNKKIRAAVLGASGYAGADLIRLAARHPNIALTSLIAKGHAGQPLAQVFPHLAGLDLPKLVTSDEVDWSKLDVVFCGLPHGTAHSEIGKLPERIRIIDMSADFRLRNPAVYAEWYGGEHSAPHLLANAVYGLAEHYADKIKSARIVACPGCYPTAVLLALLPPMKTKLIEPHDIIIDAKSGVSGAGRTLKQNILFSGRARGFRLTASAITGTCRRWSRSSAPPPATPSLSTSRRILRP